MKKFTAYAITLFCIAISTTGFAQSLNHSDPATALSKGNILTTKEDFTLSRKALRIFSHGKDFFATVLVENRPFCKVKATNLKGKELKLVSVNGSTKFNIDRVESDGSNVTILTEAQNGILLSLECYKKMINGRGTTVPTIGEVVQSLRGYIDIGLAGPDDSDDSDVSGISTVKCKTFHVNYTFYDRSNCRIDLGNKAERVLLPLPKLAQRGLFYTLEQCQELARDALNKIRAQFLEFDWQMNASRIRHVDQETCVETRMNVYR